MRFLAKLYFKTARVLHTNGSLYLGALAHGRPGLGRFLKGPPSCFTPDSGNFYRYLTPFTTLIRDHLELKYLNMPIEKRNVYTLIFRPTSQSVRRSISEQNDYRTFILKSKSNYN